MTDFKRSKLAIAFLLGSIFATAPAHAASYKKLIAKGYKTGKLTKNRAGILGWQVTGEGKTYFCNMNVTFYIDEQNKMSMFLGGRMTSDPMKDELPKLRDLKAGNPRPQDVGRCIPS